jgi:hypothetical protein
VAGSRSRSTLRRWRDVDEDGGGGKFRSPPQPPVRRPREDDVDADH